MFKSTDGGASWARMPFSFQTAAKRVVVDATGTVYVGRQFVVESGTEATALGVNGNVIVNQDFLIRSRSEWSAYTNNQWDTFYSNFSLQLTLTNAQAALGRMAPPQGQGAHR